MLLRNVKQYMVSVRPCSFGYFQSQFHIGKNGQIITSDIVQKTIPMTLEISPFHLKVSKFIGSTCIMFLITVYSVRY